MTGRVDNHYYDFKPSIGYEISLNKKKTYFSLYNEFIPNLSIYRNEAHAWMTTLNINRQIRNIPSLGIGLKHNFINTKNQNNFVALASYKQDLFKYKLTFSANILFEIYKIIPSPGGLTCISNNCPTRANIWRYGIAVGKYF